MVQLEGEHDVSTASDLRQTIDRIFETGTCLVVDLSGAAFLDSSVLGELIRANERAKASPDEKMAVVAQSASNAARVLDLAGVDDTWFRRFWSIAVALDWCRRATAQVQP